LNGSLPRDGFDRLPIFAAELKSHLLHFELDTSRLCLQLTPEDIDRDFAVGSFPHRLLSSLAETEIDHEALQVAFELIKECGQ
jgi:hypothetical protein